MKIQHIHKRYDELRAKSINVVMWLELWQGIDGEYWFDNQSFWLTRKYNNSKDTYFQEKKVRHFLDNSYSIQCENTLYRVKTNIPETTAHNIINAYHEAKKNGNVHTHRLA